MASYCYMITPDPMQLAKHKHCCRNSNGRFVPPPTLQPNVVRWQIQKPDLKVETEKKCELINPVVRQATVSTPSKSYSWNGECVRKAQTEDPDINPILELKELH